MSVIDRPDTSFDGPSHSYGLEGWDKEDVMGCSTIAKVGGFEETWGIASAWGFRIGYEGTYQLLGEVDDDMGAYGEWHLPWTGPDDLREELKKRGLTPWSTRDKAAQRGTWVHDVLEALAQNGTVPALTNFESEEVRGHIRSVLKWYIEFRPTFVATEVQVASRKHGFAGRYDIRCLIPARKLLHLFKGHDSDQARRIGALCAMGAHGDALCLIDLKTSKGIYPTTHFPQLSGYEVASTEMGFPATDCQLVLNSKPDGSPAVLGASWSTGEDFVAFLGALRAVRRIQANDPEVKLAKMREEDILLELGDGPARSRELAERVPTLQGLDGRSVGFILGRLKKRGLVRQEGRGYWVRQEAKLGT